MSSSSWHMRYVSELSHNGQLIQLDQTNSPKHWSYIALRVGHRPLGLALWASKLVSSAFANDLICTLLPGSLETWQKWLLVVIDEYEAESWCSWRHFNSSNVHAPGGWFCCKYLLENMESNTILSWLDILAVNQSGIFKSVHFADWLLSNYWSVAIGNR